MRRVALFFLFISALSVGLTGCSSSSHTSNSASARLAYVTLSSVNQIAGFNVDSSSGALSPVTGSPFATGQSAFAIVVHPSKKFLYVANAGENTVSLFTMSNAGALSEVAPRTRVGDHPLGLALSADGNLLFVSNTNSNNLSVFSINTGTGALTEVSTSPVLTDSPTALAILPGGSTLYVANSNSSSVSAFSIGSAGSLTPVGGSPYPTGTNPSALSVDSAGHFLYVANLDSQTFSGFSITSSTGGLTPMPGSPYFLTLGTTNTTTSTPVSVAVDTTNNYLFVPVVNPVNIYGYAIDGTSGVPSNLSGSPFTTSATGLAFSLVDASGKFLYVGNQGSSSISLFDIASDTGALTSVGTVNTGSAPTSMVLVP
ncbi:MAG TPA: beta-propeller fold lactonase family protein [Terriglobales bacterium]|nr:beta-propeller fold lactonase family protein [Terriglobales bacterium]